MMLGKNSALSRETVHYSALRLFLKQPLISQKKSVPFATLQISKENQYQYQLSCLTISDMTT